VGEVDCREGGNVATIHVAPRLMLGTIIYVKKSPAQKFAVFAFVGIDCNPASRLRGRSVQQCLQRLWTIV
jgi:hypothetical protein